MADRCLEIVVPLKGEARLVELLEGARVFRNHRDNDSGICFYRVLVPMHEVEERLDAIQGIFSSVEGFGVLVLPVEAVLPRTLDPPSPKRIAREELIEDLIDAVGPSTTYYTTVVLSTVVAALGLARGNSAIVIGAMVIAPMLGPNMALALATTLGDRALMLRSIRANLGGVAVAFAAAMGLGLLLHVDPTQPEIAARAHLAPTDLLLGLASGAAGALACTSGVSAALVGVMVAVALLPPTVVCGMLLVNGYSAAAGQAALLLWANVVCINLSAVTVFLLQHLRPRTWWEKRRSVWLSNAALLFWGTSLALALAAAWWF